MLYYVAFLDDNKRLCAPNAISVVGWGIDAYLME